MKSKDELEAVVGPMRKAAEESKALLTQLRIADERGFAFAQETLLWVKGEWTRIDGERKKITGPIRDAERNTNAFFAPPLAALIAAEAHLKSEIVRWQRATEAARISQAQAGAEITLAPAVPSAGIRTQTVERWEITDPEKVPRQFCSPDLRIIREHLAAGGVRAIPGVRFWTEDQVVASRKGAP